MYLQKVPLIWKKPFEKKLFSSATDEKSRIRIWIRICKSVVWIQWSTDPYLYQNVTNPQHWLEEHKTPKKLSCNLTSCWQKGGGGRPGRGAYSYYRKKAWSSTNHSILSGEEYRMRSAMSCSLPEVTTSSTMVQFWPGSHTPSTIFFVP